MPTNLSLCLAIPILLAGVLTPSLARAQSQDSQTQSVAEAARKAREQKKAAPKPTTVITEDTLKPRTEEQKAVEAANEAQASANTEKAPESNTLAKPEAKPDSSKPDDAKKKKEKAELDALKRQLAEAKKSLDLLQRELALDQDTYLSNPDHDHDTAGKAKLEGLKQQISDKEQQVDVLKTKVAALQELLGAEASWEPAPQQ